MADPKPKTTKKPAKKAPAKKKPSTRVTPKKTAKKTAAKRPASKKVVPKKALKKTTPAKKGLPERPSKATITSQKLVQTLAQQPVRWKQLYALGSVLVLFFTTVLWALMGTQLHQSNADQLADPALFGSTKVLRLAQFPGTHTFLLKWPLFWIIKLCGYSDIAYYGLTVLAAVLTVGGLAYIIYRIERRPLVFSAIILALSSVLLLVPAVPSAGTLLPVNMAMLTTRNLEYVAYILGLVFLVRAHRRRSWTFVWAVATLGLVVASDKLFLTLSLGGAFLTLAVSLATKQKAYRHLGANWLLQTALAGLGASFVLWLLQALHVTHFVNAGTSSPYALVLNLKHLLLGSYFAVFHAFTNFGANPAYDSSTFRALPGGVAHGLLRLGGLAYLVNAVVLAGVLVATARLSLSALRAKQLTKDQPTQLTLLLVASSLVAVLAFVATDHYFFADGRYLTIVVFTGFIGFTTYARHKTYKARHILLISCALLIAMLCGLTVVNRTQNKALNALQATNERNELVAQALKNHHVGSLLGDYWRVLPISQLNHNKTPVTPLADCTTPRLVLASGAWQTNLDTQSFAYLVTLDASLSDFPACSLEQIVKTYGRPNASTLIAGQLNRPKELLLFYDHGRNKSTPSPQVNTPASSTVLPIKLSQLPKHDCAQQSIVNVVAHEDDDLLFMSPTLLHQVQGQDCVRTIYLTAGDAGGDKLYWTAREKAAEAAYSNMLKSDEIWEERIVRVSDHHYAIVASPRGNPRISLVFMRLPDGNLRGQGFRDNGFESLQAIESGRRPVITSVDLQSSYSRDELVDTLSSIISFYKPRALQTQADYNAGHFFSDHSDHLATGRLVNRVRETNAVLANVPTTYYIGYPVHELEPNVGGQDLADKSSAFYAYAQYDGAVCRNQEQCNHGTTLGFYLERMYTTDDVPGRPDRR